MRATSPHTLGEVFRANAAQFADKAALIDRVGRATSFGTLNERANRLATALGSRGVGHGARVAILSRNRPEYVQTYGVAKSGLIPMPLNWRLSSIELSRLLRHGAPEAIFADTEFAPLVDALADEVPSLAHRIAFDPPGTGWTSFEALLEEGSPNEPDIVARPDDIVVLMYTSGTTGTPKGVAITHAAALDNARVVAAGVVGLRPSDVSLAVMPLFHVGGMWFHLFASLVSGCTTVILPEFEAASVLETMTRDRISNVHLVPTMIGALTRHPGLATADLAALRVIFYAASSMPVDLLRRAMDAFAGCTFVQSYGSTEAGVLTALLSDDHRRDRDVRGDGRLASCGAPLAGRELRLVDDADADVAPGAAGEIVVRHPGVMSRYWEDDDRTAVAFRGGWLHTGDMGRFDDDGYLTIVDRKDDLLISGGENVYPTEVEQALYRHADVLEAAVFGVPDPQWIDRIVAAVVLRVGAVVTSDELVMHLRSHLAAYKCPKQIFVVDALPRSSVGKVLRKELRKQYSGATAPLAEKTA